MRLNYCFTIEKDAPAPLSYQVGRKVRFEEVDSMNVVWHGRYPSFLEDARVELGNRLGVGYDNFKSCGYAIPIVRMNIEYLNPLRFGETFIIEASMCYSRAARINIAYKLWREDAMIATASTVQLIISHDGALCLTSPDFYYNFCEQWQQGGLNFSNGFPAIAETPGL
jgi:acyl-CoA thioester hydrolase